MKAVFLLIEKDPKETEVWIQRESGEMFIVHPTFIQSNGEFTQVGFIIDDNKAETLNHLNLDFYPRLNEKCDLIGLFNKTDSILEHEYKEPL